MGSANYGARILAIAMFPVWSLSEDFRHDMDKDGTFEKRVATPLNKCLNNRAEFNACYQGGVS